MNATMLELDIFYLAQWDASTNQTLRAGVVALLEDPEPEIRARAADMIQRHMPANPAVRSNVLAIASRQLHSSDKEERKCAVALLSSGALTR